MRHLDDIPGAKASGFGFPELLGTPLAAKRSLRKAENVNSTDLIQQARVGKVVTTMLAPMHREWRR